GPRHDVHDYFRAADLFALPSIREGLPIALLEAMACGLPCVASALPGSTDTLIDSGQNGLLVPPDDRAMLTSLLASVLSSPTLAVRLGAGARATIESRYSIERTAVDWLDAYQSL